MARRRAGKKSSAPPDAPEADGGDKAASASGGPVGAIFRFLGSLKLAVAQVQLAQCTPLYDDPAHGEQRDQLEALLAGG